MTAPHAPVKWLDSSFVMVYAAIDSTDTLEGLTSRDGWQDVGTLLVVAASFETRNRGKNKLSISKTPARRATTAARRLQRRAEMAGRGKDAAQDTSRFLSRLRARHTSCAGAIA